MMNWIRRVFGCAKTDLGKLEDQNYEFNETGDLSDFEHQAKELWSEKFSYEKNQCDCDGCAPINVIKPKLSPKKAPKTVKKVSKPVTKKKVSKKAKGK